MHRRTSNSILNSSMRRKIDVGNERKQTEKVLPSKALKCTYKIKQDGD